MSGTSYVLDCGRCGSKNALFSSSESKPFDYNSADCLNCGFSYFTKIYILKKDELNKLRKQINFKSSKLTKQ